MCHPPCSLMQHRIVFYQQPAMTLSKYVTRGGISHSIWMCLNCKLFTLKKNTSFKSCVFFHPPWKYLSWMPLFSCNSPSSCFTVSHCQRFVWFISQVLVGQGLPHGTPGLGKGEGGPERQAKPHPPEPPPPGSGGSRWEANLTSNPDTGCCKAINCLPCRWAEKNRSRGGMSVWASREVFFGVMFIFMYCKTNMDPSKIHAYTHWVR